MQSAAITLRYRRVRPIASFAEGVPLGFRNDTAFADERVGFRLIVSCDPSHRGRAKSTRAKESGNNGETVVPARVLFTSDRRNGHGGSAASKLQCSRCRKAFPCRS